MFRDITALAVTHFIEAHFCSKYKNKLRTIPAAREEQSLIFSI